MSTYHAGGRDTAESKGSSARAGYLLRRSGGRPWFDTVRQPAQRRAIWLGRSPPRALHDVQQLPERSQRLGLRSRRVLSRGGYDGDARGRAGAAPARRAEGLSPGPCRGASYEGDLARRAGRRRRGLRGGQVGDASAWGRRQRRRRRGHARSVVHGTGRMSGEKEGRANVSSFAARRRSHGSR
jgi:hypothetical protein